jgi:hypothetical protein
MTKQKEGYDPKTTCMLQYVKDVSIAPNTDPANMQMKQFRWKIAMYWFILNDPQARESLKAGRIRILYIGKDNRKRGKQPEAPTA